MNRILARIGWTCLALMVVLMVGLVVAREMFARYLHSEGFRRTLGEGAANALQAERADFSPLEFDGALVYGQNFHATREDGGGFSTMDADQLRATFDWHGLLHHTVQIDELAVQRLRVEPPGAGAAMAAMAGMAGMEGMGAAPLGGGTQGMKGRWTVDLRKAVVGEADWQWAESGGMEGTALRLKPEGQNGWGIEAQGGTLRQAGWPTLELETGSLRWQSPTLYINESSLRDGAGQMRITGSVETRRAVNLQVKFEGVDVHPFLTPDWRERLSGRMGGEAKIDAQLGAQGGEGATVSGSLALQDGRLTALPILDQIGLFTHTERFRQMDLTRATADFTRRPGRIEVRNMVMESAGLICVKGAYRVENGNINGTFEVGLTPATLQWIPGSQGEIFTDSKDGYLWTSVNLSGPVTNPVDDLTPRLAAATGKSVIQGVEGAVGGVKKAAEGAVGGALDLLLH